MVELPGSLARLTSALSDRYRLERELGQAIPGHMPPPPTQPGRFSA